MGCGLGAATNPADAATPTFSPFVATRGRDWPFDCCPRCCPKLAPAVPVARVTSGLPPSILGSPQKMVYLGSGWITRLHFGSDADRLRRVAMGRNRRGERRTPVG